MPPQANDWNEYKKLVLKELERLDEKLEKLSEQVTSESTLLREQLVAFASSIRKDIREELVEAKRDLASTSDVQHLEDRIEKLEAWEHAQVLSRRWVISMIVAVIGTLLTSLAALAAALL